MCLDASENNATMPLWNDMEEVEVTVTFNASRYHDERRTLWCDNIELFIDYDILWMGDYEMK